MYNTYASVVKTKNGGYTLCGFNYGMQPTYSINADGTVQETNSIEVTLTDSHDNGGTLDFFDNVDYEYLSARTWEYTSRYGGYECVEEGVARYLLKSEYDVLGNETGRYMAYSGHNADFADMNIVGTFNEDARFKNPECVGMGCRLNASIPSEVVFNTIGCKTYYINSDSPWSATSSSSNITISPTSGSSNVGYNFKICNTLEPTSTPRTSTITIEYCDTASTFNAKVVEGNSCLPQGSTYNISANAQTLTIPTKCCVENVRETVGVGSIINIYSNYITVQVPENNTGFYRTITLLVIFCDGSSGNIIINQSDVFEAWFDEYSSCVGYDKYERQYKYSGHSSSSITSRTDEYRDILVEVNSEDCGYVEPIYRWFDTNVYICSGVAKYHVAKQQVSNDNGSTWEDVIPITTGTGSIWEAQSEDCGYIPPQYRTSTGASYCVGYNRYADVVTEVSYDRGETWSVESTTPTLFEIDSTFCGVLYRWTPSGETCVGYDKYVLAVKQKSYNNGLSWSDVDPLTTSAITLIEVNSEDCGYSPLSRWVKTNNTACDVDYKVKIVNNSTQEVTYVPLNGSSALTQSEIFNNISSGGTYNIFVGSYVKRITEECFANSGSYNIDLHLYVPNTVTNIEGGAFAGRNYGINSTINIYFEQLDLTNVEQPNSGASGWTFAYNDALKTVGGVGSGCDVEIPNHWEQLVYLMFFDCHELTSVEIPSNIKNIGEFNVTSPQNQVFLNCHKLQNLKLNEGLEIIGDSAFKNCWELGSSVVIPNSVKKIGTHAFDEVYYYNQYDETQWQPKLKEITVGSGCNEIGYCAFASCVISGMSLVDDYLEKLTILATTPPALNYGGIFISDFYPRYISLNDLKVKIYVPSGSVNTYKTDQYWSKYSDIIYSI
jgi:hypothetical protein